MLTWDISQTVEKLMKLVQSSRYLDETEWTEEKVVEFIQADLKWYLTDGIDADEHQLIDSMLNWVE